MSQSGFDGGSQPAATAEETRGEPSGMQAGRQTIGGCFHASASRPGQPMWACSRFLETADGSPSGEDQTLSKTNRAIRPRPTLTRQLGRSSDSRINRLPAPSRESCDSQWQTVLLTLSSPTLVGGTPWSASDRAGTPVRGGGDQLKQCRFCPRIQRRDRDGFAPSSLFSRGQHIARAPMSAADLIAPSTGRKGPQSRVPPRNTRRG